MATLDDFQIPKTGMFGGSRAPALTREASIFDAATGVLVIVLSILGLADAAPRTMAALCCMAAGVAVVFEGAGVVGRYRRLASFYGRREHPEIRGAMIAELLGGIVGFALGLLALAGIEPLSCLAVAIIVFGGALWLGTGAEIEMDSAKSALDSSDTRLAIHEAVIAASGARLLVAAAAVTLGILALAGVATLQLILTASLLLGVALILGSVSIGDRVTPREYLRSTAS
jgi:hypothetical protein